MSHRTWMLLSTWTAWFVVWTALGGLGVATPARAQEIPPASFGDRTDVVVVEVPVRVLADGEPVRGLSADDFRVFDAGVEREISGFELHDVTEGAAGGGAEVPFAARRYFLLLFDLDFTDGHYLERAYDAARELVDDGLRPSDMVAVAFFSQRAGVSSVLGFTPDRRQVTGALDGLGRYLGRETAEPAADGETAEKDVLGLTAGGWEAVLADLGQARERERSLAGETAPWIGTGGGGRRPDGVAETVRDMAVFAAEDMRQKRASRASALAGSLRDLARQYRWIDGQKYLVLFSRGFESDLYLADGGSWLLTELRQMISGFREEGWTIYSIEGADLNTPQNKARRESLLMVARGTGGALISGENDFVRSMGEVLEQTSVTYVLSFASPGLPEDGSFRELRVELAEGARAPRGAGVIHRAGYFAPKPFGEMDREERRAATAELVLAGREIDEIGCRVLAAPAEEVGGGGVRVPVMMEIDAPGLLAARAWQATRVEAMAYAFGADGEIAGSWGRDFFMAPDVVAKAARAGSVVFYGDLVLAPGRYELRSLVRNVEDGRAALRVTALHVPEIGSGEAVLMEPIFADLLREGEEETGQRILIRDVSSGAPYPFVFGEHRFLPAIAPSVVRGTETMVVGRGVWSEPPSGLRALVFDANGFPAPGGIAARLLGQDGLEEEGDAGPRVRQLALGLRATGLPAGDYELRLVFQGPDGLTVSSPPAAFRVIDATSELR